ncbi:hypothetical protein U9M48_029479 [Paspalum notatum var. saurae]|uniref:Uncharacterized protein n=1 Tax=Paspalum notatum var. saurae TaxID=547442 RepID=A0AAQ3U331_PASNO
MSLTVVPGTRFCQVKGKKRGKTDRDKAALLRLRHARTRPSSGAAEPDAGVASLRLRSPARRCCGRGVRLSARGLAVL